MPHARRDVGFGELEMYMKSVYLIPVFALLCGCASKPTIGSVAGGECKITHTPSYVVKGKTSYDQEWIDDTTAALIVGCRQPRPKARPASIDNPPHLQIRMTSPTTGVTVKPKKKHWWQR